MEDLVPFPRHDLEERGVWQAGEVIPQLEFYHAQIVASLKYLGQRFH